MLADDRDELVGRIRDERVNREVDVGQANNLLGQRRQIFALQTLYEA